MSFEPATLDTVHSFRGLPSNLHDEQNYRRSLAQQSEWTRDRRSIVTYRPLKYRSLGGGRFDVKEKGIDVLVALELVRVAAALTDPELVILAAHDTDLEPALELACQLAPGRVETTGWMNSKRLRAPGQEIWHTRLDEQAFIRSRDLRQY